MQTKQEIDVHQLARAIEDSEQQFIILDVRQPWELLAARLEDERVIALPMSQLAVQAAELLPTPDPDHDDIFVLCHHGLRSGAVARWLRSQGWPNSYNVSGGLDAYQRLVDPSIGSY